MPCNCDGYEPSVIDVTVHEARCVLRELDGEKLTPADWRNARAGSGYSSDCDAIVAEACDRLKHVDVSKYSLELQMWWRDHQEADRRREEKERQKAAEDALRAAALAKLSPEERKVLGL